LHLYALCACQQSYEIPVSYSFLLDHIVENKKDYQEKDAFILSFMFLQGAKSTPNCEPSQNKSSSHLKVVTTI
jgi:hypothetical protein